MARPTARRRRRREQDRQAAARGKREPRPAGDWSIVDVPSVSRRLYTWVVISSGEIYADSDGDVKPGARRPVQSAAMTDTRLWDRAADGSRPRRRPAAPGVAALPDGAAGVAELFDFMRDAELRFGTLRLRIVERTRTARGEDAVAMDVGRCATPARRGSRRAAGRAVGGPSTRSGSPTASSSGPTRAPTARHAATRPQSAARPGRPRLPGHLEGLRAGHRPARWRPCPTRSSTPPATARTCWRPGAARSPDGDRRRPRGDQPELRPPAHDRAARRPAGLPHRRSSSIATPG